MEKGQQNKKKEKGSRPCTDVTGPIDIRKKGGGEGRGLLKRCSSK